MRAAGGDPLSLLTRLPAGDALVFLLAAAFSARRWQARRLATAPA